jgi:hypothetical protein
MVNKFAIWVEIFKLYNVYFFYRYRNGKRNGLGNYRNRHFEKARSPVLSAIFQAILTELWSGLALFCMYYAPETKSSFTGS